MSYRKWIYSENTDPSRFFFWSRLQDLRCSLLAQIQSAPSDVLEELKVRLQLKDRLFQEVLADRTHQVQEHQEQVQDLLRTISCRDQYIQVGQRSSVETLGSGLKLLLTRISCRTLRAGSMRS